VGGSEICKSEMLLSSSLQAIALPLRLKISDRTSPKCPIKVCSRVPLSISYGFIVKSALAEANVV